MREIGCCLMGLLCRNQGLWDSQSEGVHGHLALDRLDRVNRNGNRMAISCLKNY